MIVRVVLALIRLYQVTCAPLLGPVCRFEPSCSRYAMICFETHGLWRGLWLTLVRLGKCHPYHPGGVDLPPPRAPSHLSRAAHSSPWTTTESAR